MKIRDFFVLVLSLGFLGCAKNNASLELARICSQPTPSATGGCVYPASCTLGDLLNQYVDLGVSPGVAGAYLWTPIQVNNQMPNNEDIDIGRLNTNDAFIEEYRITYRTSAVALPGVVFRVGPQVVSAATSAVLLVPIVPVTTGDLLAPYVGVTPLEVMATVKAAGRLADGTTFETGEYLVAVEVCDGCLSTPSCEAGEQLACCAQAGQTSTCSCITL